MNSEQQELWSSIRSFDIDGGPASFTYANRLARENGWSSGHANRVIEEYRKFVFLCAAAGHPCSPSDDVDEAWHLHLTYTESYWTRLTPLLPRPLHHGPTKGGKAESTKFADWYQKTLDSYERLFGEVPPRDIWPTAAERAASKHSWKRIDTARYLMIPKAGLSRALQFSAIGSLALLGAVGCNYFAQAESGISSILIGLVVVGVVIMLLGLASQAAKKKGQGGRGSSSSGSHFSGTGSHFTGTGSHFVGGGCSSTHSPTEAHHGGPEHGHGHGEGHGHGQDGHGDGHGDGQGDGSDGGSDGGGSDGGGGDSGGSSCGSSCGGGCGGGGD